MSVTLPVFATRDRHHSANVHLVVAIGPADPDDIASMREHFPHLVPEVPNVATFACGRHSGFDYQLVDCETEKPFCDWCLLADMNPAVYRVFDKFDRLLYVGSTGALIERFFGHRSNKARWLQTAVRVSVDTYVDLAAARRAEKEAIASELPLFNKRGIPVAAWTCEA